MIKVGKKIVILMFQYSVVVKGIENRLKEEGYDIEVITGSFGTIWDYDPDSAVFVLYLPGDIMDNERELEALTELTGTAVSRRCRMVVLGERVFHTELTQKIPGIQVFEWMDKPVDMEKFSLVLEKMFSMRVNSSAQRRILIVDDDPSYAKMVRAWIKDEYRVDVVTAGMQAISFLLKVHEDEKVDLILLDYEMPVVDGPQVLQMLRQEPATAKIPVIFLTGIGTKEAVSRVMELKPDGYILKSTTRADLIAFLHKKLP